MCLAKKPENGAPVDNAAVADDSVDEGTATGSILDSNKLFLIQMPPLPHPSALYTDGPAERTQRTLMEKPNTKAI